MIQRRQFLGSVVAFGVASGSFSQSLSAATVTSDLKWPCEIIETIPHLEGERSPVVTGVSLQPTGDLLAIVGDDHFVAIYDIVKQAYTHHLRRHTDWIRAARFSPNGTQLATGGNDRALLIWDAQHLSIPIHTHRHPGAIIQIAYSPDGNRLATVGFESWLRVYDPQLGEETGRLKCPCSDNHAVAFSGDARWIAAGGRCGRIRVWDAANGKQVAEFKAHRKRIRTIEFTDDGKILSAGDDQIVRLTDPLQPALNQSFPRHASKLYATALLGDGLVATGGSDNQVHVWKLSDLTEVGSLSGHTGTVSCADYSAKKLVTGSFDTHVRLWSTQSDLSGPQQRHTNLTNGWSRKIK